MGPTTQTTAQLQAAIWKWVWKKLPWDSSVLLMRPCAGQSELWHRYFGNFILNIVYVWTVTFPLRLRAMIHLNMCWHALVVLVDNMLVLLQEPWGWRLSLFISKPHQCYTFYFQYFKYNNGISHVLHFRYSGVLSAYGLALADVVEEVQEPCSLKYEQDCFPELDRRVEKLSKRCHDTLCARGFTRSGANEHF